MNSVTSSNKYECVICCNEFYCRYKIQPCGHEICFYCLSKIKICPFCRQTINNAFMYHDDEVNYLDIYGEMLSYIKKETPLFNSQIKKKIFHSFEFYLLDHPYPQNLDKVIILISQHDELERDILMHAFFSSIDNTKVLFNQNGYLFDKIDNEQVKLLNIRKQAFELGTFDMIETEINKIRPINVKDFNVNYFTTIVCLNDGRIINFVQYNIGKNNDIVLTSSCSYELILEIVKCYLSLEYCIKHEIRNAHDFYLKNEFSENEIMNVIKKKDLWNKIEIYYMAKNMYDYVKQHKIVSLFSLRKMYLDTIPQPISELLYPKITAVLTKNGIICTDQIAIYAFKLYVTRTQKINHFFTLQE